MDKYQELEQKGRTTFTNLCPNIHVCELQFTTDKYARTDVFYLSGASLTRTSGEIKTREYASTRFPDWLIEKSKYDELQAQLASGEIETAVYINIFQDNKTLIWNLNNCTPTWKQEEHFENHTKQKKVLKWVAYLPTSGASHSFINR